VTRLNVAALAIGLASTGPSIHAAAQAPALRDANPITRDAPVLADFKARIAKYVAMGNKADDTAPAPKTTTDSADIKVAQDALARRIRTARAGAKPGDIFSPEIAAYFRRRLQPELKEAETKASIKDDNPGAVPFKVNEPYPEKSTLSTVPPNVLETLPKLPESIEYRFIGKHLILRDARANLIIDYLLNAIP
jgi:hypothetical protein